MSRYFAIWVTMTGSRQPYVKLTSLFYTQLVMFKWPQYNLTLNLPSTMFHSFFACALLGYWSFRVPLFETICSAVNGLRVYLHRESVHHFLTSSTSFWYCCSSASILAMVEEARSQV